LRPAYGQQSIYQAEDPGAWNAKFPGYGYDSLEYITGQDTNENWMGEPVRSRRCMVGRDTPGYMVKDLYENREQVNDTRILADTINSNTWERLFSDIKQPKYNNRG
jgi:hypothetical protein